MDPITHTRGEYVISTDKSRLDPVALHDYLKDAYWCKGIPYEFVKRAIKHTALCFGVYSQDQQVGYARIISDITTFAYLADVYIHPDHQGHGLGKWLMECIMAHPELKHIRRWTLATKDAHGLYEQYGFKPLARPQRLMEIVDLEIYQKMKNKV